MKPRSLARAMRSLRTASLSQSPNPSKVPQRLEGPYSLSGQHPDKCSNLHRATKEVDENNTREKKAFAAAYNDEKKKKKLTRAWPRPFVPLTLMRPSPVAAGPVPGVLER